MFYDTAINTNTKGGEDMDELEYQGLDTEPAEDTALPADDEEANDALTAPVIPEQTAEADTFADNTAFAAEQQPAFPDPMFNVPPMLSQLEGLDRESFWAEVDKARPPRRLNKSILIVSIIMFLMSMYFLLTAIYGQGWLIRLFNGGRNINFTFPIAETPKLESEYYQPDGRYTVEGIANAISPSVVAIEVYTGDMVFVPSSQGSGIIMSKDGYILTNAHVIEGGKKIKAVLYNQTEYAAELIGADNAADIAVIKISAAELTPAQFGDSDSVSLGEDIVAIGSPAGFYGTVTKGIVSGKNRMIKVESFSLPMRCIQIDAAINPGNSGGALVNMWGQVVGITSSKLSSKSYDGIGFAISINSAKPIIEDIISQTDLEKKARIGISFYAVTEETAVMQGIKAGLFIASIDPECDIASTDLRAGDIIMSIDGVTVTDTETVGGIIAEHKPGDRLTAKCYRPDEETPNKGEQFEISFLLMPDQGEFVEKND